MLKIALSQQNFTVGDFFENVNGILSAMRRAHAAGADLVVFTELAITGYYPKDLLEEQDFLDKAEGALDRIIRASREFPGLTAVVGTVRKNKGAGKPLHNALLAIEGGAIKAEYYKQLLPTYNIFDERRHFEPGPAVASTLQICGQRVAFLICEDIWSEEGDGFDYAVNPYKAVDEQRPDLLISINASPSNVGKRKYRHDLFAAASHRHNLPIVYVNQVGGQDDLVFDGASFAVSPSQRVAFELPSFQESFGVVGFDRGQFKSADALGLPAIAPAASASEFYYEQIVLGLRDYARRTGFTTAVIGSSGGIDSAVTKALAVAALGAENVVGITMPSKFSSEGSVSDSEKLAINLGAKLYNHPIVDEVEAYRRDFERAFGRELKGLALENVQARIRGTILMEYSNTYGALLLTTGNKSEISVGYCTLYGDTNGGLGLIGDLYKTEVFELARYINERAGYEVIPESIINKAPSAELAPGQQDTDSLPPYAVLDEILKFYIEGARLSLDEYVKASTFVLGFQDTEAGAATIARVRGMINRNEYKRRQSPPIIRVRARAFGSGRQMPLTAKY
jgi:NAD+ synthase (glutamine-hydrolysing)